MKIYKVSEMAKLLNVSIKTLQRWDKLGILIAKRTPTNRRFYTENQLQVFMNGNNTKEGESK